MEGMDSLRLCAYAIMAVLIIALMREYEGRFVPFLRIAVMIVTAGISISLFAVVYRYVEEGQGYIAINGDVGEIFSAMMKITGISFLGCITSSVCKDTGENGIALAVETVCKLEIILLCLPVIDIILKKIAQIIV